MIKLRFSSLTAFCRPILCSFAIGRLISTLDGLFNSVRIFNDIKNIDCVQQEAAMTVRIEKDGPVWTVIHDRPEARNAMDPQSADALTAAFLEFDRDKSASVAVFHGAGGAFCAGWDLKYVSTLDAKYPLGELDIPPAGPRGNGGEIPRGPLGPSRLELDKPVIAAIEGPAVPGGLELGPWCDFRVMAEDSYFGVYGRRSRVRRVD